MKMLLTSEERRSLGNHVGAYDEEIIKAAMDRLQARQPMVPGDCAYHIRNAKALYDVMHDSVFFARDMARHTDDANQLFEDFWSAYGAMGDALRRLLGEPTMEEAKLQGK